MSFTPPPSGSDGWPGFGAEWGSNEHAGVKDDFLADQPINGNIPVNTTPLPNVLGV